MYGSPRPWRCSMYVSQTLTPSHSRVVTAILSSTEEQKENTQKQQLFAEPPSHLLYQLTESWVKKLIFSSNTYVAHKWDRSNSEVLGWIRARLSFAILRATNLCLRSSHTKWRSAIGMDDAIRDNIVGILSRSIKSLCLSIYLSIYLLRYPFF